MKTSICKKCGMEGRWGKTKNDKWVLRHECAGPVRDGMVRTFQAGYSSGQDWIACGYGKTLEEAREKLAECAQRLMIRGEAHNFEVQYNRNGLALVVQGSYQEQCSDSYPDR